MMTQQNPSVEEGLNGTANGLNDKLNIPQSPDSYNRLEAAMNRVMADLADCLAMAKQLELACGGK